MLEAPSNRDAGRLSAHVCTILLPLLAERDVEATPLRTERPDAFHALVSRKALWTFQDVQSLSSSPTCTSCVAFAVESTIARPSCRTPSHSMPRAKSREKRMR